MILEHRSRWVCAHIIQLPKGKEQPTHCVHPRKKKTTCCGEDKSGFSKAAGDIVDDKCWILARMCGVGRLNVLCHLINFTLSWFSLPHSLIKRMKQLIRYFQACFRYYYQLKWYQQPLLLEKEIKHETQVRNPQFGSRTVPKLTPFVTKPNTNLDKKGHILGIRQFQQVWRQEKHNPHVLLNVNHVRRNPVNHRDYWHLIAPVCPLSIVYQQLRNCWHKSEGASEQATLLTILLPNCGDLVLGHAIEFARFFDCQILWLPCCCCS